MPAATLTHVVFDMDGVLCRYDFARRLAVMSAGLKLPPDTIEAAIFTSGLDNEADLGRHSIDSYLAGMAERLGVAVEPSLWLEARRQAMTPDDDVVALVEAISGRVEVAMLTNNGPLLQRHIDGVFPTAGRLFGARAFFSCQFGTGKETPAVFRQMLHRLDAEAERTLFVDDWASYLENARAAGLHTHLFRGADGLREALAGYDLI